MIIGIGVAVVIVVAIILVVVKRNKKSKTSYKGINTFYEEKRGRDEELIGDL